MRLVNAPFYKYVSVVVLGTVIGLGIAGCGREKPVPGSTKPAQLLVDKQQDALNKQLTGLQKKKDKPANKQQSSVIPETENPLKDSGPKLIFTQKEITLSWAQKGSGRQMYATAHSSDFNAVTQQGSVHDFKGQLYENDKLTASIAAPKAVIDAKTRIITATGGVTLRSMERQTIAKASWMKWYADSHKIIGGGNVHIESNSAGNMMNVNAAAFQADTALKSFKVMDSTKGLNLK